MTATAAVTTGAGRIVFPVDDGLMRSRLQDEWCERLQKLGFQLHVLDAVPSSAEEWCELLRGAVGLILASRLPHGVLSACDKLEVVSFAGTGVGDRVDLDEAVRQGITVTNLTGYGDNAVAEHAIGLLLSLTRRIPQYDHSIRNGHWYVGRKGWELRGRRLGVVGLGGNGVRVTEIARGLGMDVVAWTRRASRERAARHDVEPVDLETLFEISDAVSLHIALVPSTVGFVGSDLLGRMRPGSLLVNTSRGRIVDEAALVSALRDGPLGGAALDVFEDEPLAAKNPLRGMADKTVLTPHVAYNTVAATIALVDGSVQNIIQYFEADPRNVVAGPGGLAVS